MHRDQVVGLALAILLIGVVGAFCFRNDNDGELPEHQLEDPQKLDAEIARKDHAPYLTQPEFDRSTTVSQQDHAPIANVTNFYSDEELFDEWDLPDFLKEQIEHEPVVAKSTDTNQTTRPASLTKNKTPAVNATQERIRSSPLPGPDHNAAWFVKQRPTTNVARNQSSQYRIHRVQPGDTLTALSVQYLGAMSRFHEIYNANRDKLDSPNNLPVGADLRIPIVSRESFTVSAAQNSMDNNRADTNQNGETSSQANQNRRPTTRSTGSLPTKPTFTQMAPVDILELEPLPLTPTIKTDKVKNNPQTPTSASATPADSSRLSGQTSSVKQRPIRRYKVLPGDSLERIAIKIYGDRNQARKIFEANRHVLRNPHVVRAGTTIVLP